MTTINTDVLIIGGGITGLSCAYHLEKKGFKNYILAEQADKCGGLCGSFRQDGFTFDWSGHLLHLHTDDGRKLVKTLLGSNILLHSRSAWVYSSKTLTPYPFQANLYGLPPAVISECVTGIIKASGEGKTLPFDAPFRDWALSVFGKGICKYFMLPYNEKLWRTSLSTMTADWCAPFVPKPELKEVIQGAYWEQKKKYGYNTNFFYPMKGGIQSLCDSLAHGLSGAKYSVKVEKINLQTKTATISGLGEVQFKKIVNTAPLKKFISMLADCPAAVKDDAAHLKYTTVDVLNIAFGRPVREKHWVYFPEEEFPFYRAGLTSNFSPESAPENASSFYVEAARPPSEKRDLKTLEKQIIKGLASSGLIKDGDKPLSKLWLEIPCAYVIYDAARAKAVPRIMEFLEKNRCYSIGRYGAWKYSFMEESLLEGKATAKKLAA